MAEVENNMSDTVNNEEVEFDADVFDSMLHGTFDESQEELEESVEDDVEDTEDFDEEDSEDEEDTDQEDELESDEELDEDDDGDLDEDLEDADEDEEEDTLVEDDSSDEEGGDTEDEDDAPDDEAELEVDGDTDEESEDDTETEEDNDGDDSETTDKIDYKKFYDSVVNTEFTVNGKKVKGFADPQKIIQSQQMAGGFAEKMAGFKKYRPYMAPLKDRGMLDDPAKFDLAMNLIDGDKEAIKAHLKSLNLDPMDLDMDEIEYTATPATASQETLVIEDTLDRAKSMGVEDRVRQVIGNEWDPESFQEFVSNEAVRNDLLNHMETGAYDMVQDKISEMSRLDYNGSFNNMRTIDKYRTAVIELQKENANRTPEVQESTPAPAPSRAKAVKSEKDKIVKARREEEYKEKAAKREANIIQKRKRAASMSKKKPRSKPKAKFDPMELEGSELEAHLDFLMSGGRG